MFFYLESLLQVQDLSLTMEFSKQILELYCDIVLLQTSSDSRMSQSFRKTV